MAKSIKKNFALSIIYELLAFAIPLVTAPYLSRVLGPSGVGEYSFYYNISYYFGMFALLGMNRYGTRSIATVRDSTENKERLFWELYSSQLLTSSLVVCCYLIFIAYSGSELALAWLPYLISMGLDISWLFKGEEDFKVIVIRNSLIKVLSAVLIFAFVKTSSDVILYEMITSLSTLGSQVVLWPYLRRYVIRRVRPTLSSVLRHIKPRLILMIPLAATSIYRVIDKVLIGWLAGSAQLGFFDCADKIIMVPLGVISALGSVMLPRMSYLLTNGKREEGKRLIRISMMFSMCIAMALSFGIASVGELFSVVYFGAGYEETGVLLSLLCATVPMIACASVVREQYLIPNRMDREYVISVVVGAVFNFVLNIFVIPIYGAQGAAIVTIATEALVCLMLCVSVRTQIDFKPMVIDSLPFVASGLLMYFVVRFIGGLNVGSDLVLLLLEIGIGALVFLLCMVVVGFASPRHHAFFKMVFPSLRKR